MSIRTVEHTHAPLFRVVRRAWEDPLDTSYSQTREDNRWNQRGFPALYCCCSERVAAAVATDRLRRLNVDVEDLTPDARPQLVEVDWTGRLVDVTSETGLRGNGFPLTYPEGVTIADCQRAAAGWHAGSQEGVVSRSASLYRLRWEHQWKGDHQPWGEIAIYILRAGRHPMLMSRRDDLAWLEVPERS